MKTSFLRFVLPLTALAFITPASILAGPKGGPDGEPSVPNGPTVIPAGLVSETYVISMPGSYVLGGNRSMTDGAQHIIEIAAPDVTVDLNGFTLSFPVGVSTDGAGVHITAVENVELRGGSISNGIIGVNAGPGKGLRVSDLRVIGGSTGVHSYALDTVVERCQISDTSYMGLSIVGSGSKVNDATVTGSGQFGIFALSSVQILRATVAGVAVGVHFDLYSSLRDSSISDVHGIGVEALAYTMIRH